MRIQITPAVLAMVLILSATAVSSDKHPGGYRDDSIPAIWRDTDEVTLRRAEETARMDAWAKLAEFAVGMAATAEATVSDMTDVEQKLEANLQASLSRLSDQELIHYPNGLVQCRLTVDMHELRRYLRGEEAAMAIRDEEEEILEVWGNGALAGSEGVSVVHAIRAAELDAATQLMAKLEGVRLERRTRVQDMALASDHIRSLLDAAIQGIRYTEYRVTPRSVEVDAAISFVAVIERIIRIYESDQDLCTACTDDSIAQFKSALKREQKTTHHVTGKAALTQPLETRQPNARKAIEEARHAQRQKALKNVE